MWGSTSSRPRCRRRRLRREDAARGRPASTSSSAPRSSSTETTLSKRFGSCAASPLRAGASSPRPTVSRSHPSPHDYWRWTHEGLARLFSENADWSSLRVDPGAGTAATLGMLLGAYLEIGLRRARVPGLARGPVWLLNRGAAGLDRRVALFTIRFPAPCSRISTSRPTWPPPSSRKRSSDVPSQPDAAPRARWYARATHRPCCEPPRCRASPPEARTST